MAQLLEDWDAKRLIVFFPLSNKAINFWTFFFLDGIRVMEVIDKISEIEILKLNHTITS